MKKILPYIAIIATAAFVGNMINIGLSYAKYWKSLDPLKFRNTFTVDFPLLLGPTAVTLVPALLASLTLYFFNKSDLLSRKLWLYSFLCLMITIVITASYHLPMNLKFMEQTYSTDQISLHLSRWIWLHWLRVGMRIIASVLGILGLKTSINPIRTNL